MNRKLKRVLKFMGGMSEAVIGTGISSFVPIIGYPMLIDGSSRAANSMTIETNGSIMGIKKQKGKNNYMIYQKIPSLAEAAKGLILGDDKSNFLLAEGINFLLTADVKDKSGEKITYSTHTQGSVKYKLRQLARSGFIENLECVKSSKKSNLIVPKIATGNYEEISKKQNMHDISFNLTGKEITEDFLDNFFTSEQAKRLKIIKNKDGTVKKVKMADVVWEDAFKRGLSKINNAKRLFQRNHLMLKGADEPKSKDNQSQSLDFKEELKENVIDMGQIKDSKSNKNRDEMVQETEVRS